VGLFFSEHGQQLFPLVGLIEDSRLAVDELIEVADQVKNVMRATYRLEAEEGMKKLKRQGGWRENIPIPRGASWGAGGDVHGQPPGPAVKIAAVSVHGEFDREPAFRGPDADAAGVPLAGARIQGSEYL